MRALALGVALASALASTAAAQTADPAVRYDPAPGGARLPFSPAVQVSDVLYLSGQIGSLPGTTQLAPGGVPGQAKQAMDNIGRVLAAHGLSYDNLFKCTVMLGDMSKWGEFNQVYVTYFKPDRMPARSAFGANGLAMGAALEVECWAHVPARR